MHKNFTLFLFSVLLLTLVQSIEAQTVITQWNFNSVPADASTSTGSNAPSLGAGSLASVNVTTTTFNSGTGSTDPAATDNTGLGLTGWPAQGTNPKFSGLQFGAATTGFQNINISFDLRHSNTGPKHFTVQYTTNISATTPVWVDFIEDSTMAGDVFVNNRAYNFSAITTLNNNANAGFRIVSSFRPATSIYVAATTTSSYATTGTWRFDMVTIKGTTTGGGDITAPVAQSFQVNSSTGSFVKFSEMVSGATATNIANYSFSPSLVVTGATLSATGDTVFLAHNALVNGQPYTLTVSGVQDLATNTMASANFNVVFNVSIPNLVITEIIHSPNDIEMIEVYNAGAGAINLGGLKWTDGTTGNFPEVTLAAGAKAVFATSPGTASTTLNVSPVYTILNGLGASNDILVIRNSLNQVVDSVAYFVGTNGWPAAPVGVYGYSFELNAAANDNNIGANWIVPQNPVTPQPAQGTVRATPGVYPAPPYTPTNANVSFVGVKTSITENATTVNIIANLQGGGALPSSIDIELLPLSTTTSGSDFTLPASLQFNWAANANNVNDTIKITINNDALPENAEYFIVRFTSPVNIVLPAAAVNHFTVVITDDDKQAPTAAQTITLNHIASFSNGVAGPNSAEIVAHDPVSQRLFIANSLAAKLDIVNFSNPSAASLISSISLTAYGNINSVAVKNGIVAAAIENAIPELPGKVVFFDVNGAFISQVNAGAMPDMITFNPAGTKVLTANEGQPRTDYAVDPEGSITIVDISGGVAGVTQANVTTAGFSSFNGQATSLKAAGVRIFGLNNPTVAQDMEPEYITLSADGLTAWVTCQENNAIAVVNIATSTVTAIRALGTKDHNISGNALDISDQGTTVEIARWPVKGLYMPDAIASYSIGGQTYLVTANEGDAREYSAYSEILRVSSSSYLLDPVVFPYADALKANIGRLNVTTASGDTDGDGDFDEVHAFGSRSFSIWNAATGALVWDSGEDLELITAKHPVFGAIFNASNANNTLKNRSDDKGPEPEGVTIAEILGKTFAFVALERIGGCMVYDITNPASPVFVDYKNTRTLATYGGDNGAEGIIYISAANSPTGVPIVVLANEVSSTLSFYSIDASVLDITLAGIKAVNSGARNRVDWNTSGEDKGDVFEIEKSNNGAVFNYVTTVASNGRPSAYSYWDEQPYPGLTYYRLKLKHVSGSISYSPVVTASVKATAAMIQVYPNLVKDQLTIRASGQQWMNTRVEIVDMNGRVLKKLSLTTPQTVIDISAMPAGMYTLRYMADNQSHTVKITKL
ncbi:MAG: choice-of-anchor I family protein [Ferruginibacter sp.]|nr:choice-of-anchor I family protein [Ferruginibacter sp.]